VRRASQFDIAKAAKYCARFVHTAENEKQLRVRNLSYAAMLERLTIVEIKALRAKLARFSGGQQDAAVQFHCLVVDSNLAQALLGRDDPMLREVLASSIAQLEEALRRSRAEAACPAWPPKGSRVSKVLTVVHRARPAAL
jgi:hypothetical protein